MSIHSHQGRLGGSRRAVALAVVACQGLLGCAGEPPAPPTILTLDVEHVIGGEPVALGVPYTTRYKQEVTFDYLRYWVSNVVAVSGEERFQVPASYYLMEQSPERERLSVTIKGIPPGLYDRVIFHIGVDPPHNASLDRMEGELSPGIGMDWSSDAGYTFLSTEGAFVQKDLASHFAFHTGTDVLYKELTVELPAPLALESDREAKIHLRAEIDRIFAGVQLATTPSISGGTVDSPAAQVAGNYSRMFRLVSGAEEIPIEATSPNVDVRADDGTIPSDITPPVLSNPILELPGALECAAVPDRPVSEERACVTPFLHAAASGATYDAGLLTFVTKNGAPVVAAAGGVVSDLTFIEHSMITHSDVFLITVRPSADSAFFMEYRNVKDLKVGEGDTVAAGDVLGGAGDYFAEPVGLVSFGLRRKQELTQRLCPTPFLGQAALDSYQAALGLSNEAWADHASPALCSSASLLCVSGSCELPSDFVPVGGDIDEGRRIYKESCAACHGEQGKGGVGTELCFGTGCSCKDCGDHATLAASIEKDMPPEGYCDARCSANVAAFILHEFASP
jgi:hypothetical protein